MGILKIRNVDRSLRLWSYPTVVCSIKCRSSKACTKVRGAMMFREADILRACGDVGVQAAPSIRSDKEFIVLTRHSVFLLKP